MPLQSVYHCDSNAFNSIVSNPLNLVDAPFAPSISKPTNTLAERRNTTAEDSHLMLSGADTWSDCASTHAVLGADDCGGLCQTSTPSPNFYLTPNTTYDMYQDRYIPNVNATDVDKSNSHFVEDEVSDSEIEEYQYVDDEEYSRSNSIAAFYRDQDYHMNDDDDLQEEGIIEEEQDNFNMSFVSDVATICSNESFTEDINEEGSRATFSLGSSYIHSDTAVPAGTSTSGSSATPRSFVENLLRDASDTTTSSDMSFVSASVFRVAFPSCTPSAFVETHTLRAGLMPQDPTTKYRKLIRTHGSELVNQMDMSVLYEDHLQYVAQLYRANAELAPSPFPFYSELQFQQERQLSPNFYVNHHHQVAPRQTGTTINYRVVDTDQATTNNNVVVRPLQFLPPPPPSMQTYFVASHTFSSGSSQRSKFPAKELYTKPGTGNWAAGFGPEYAATVDDGLPASHEMYDPNCEAFSKFYEVLMRWYDGVCRTQSIHTSTAVGNPLVSKLAPVPSIEDYTTNFVGWVRELNRWWDAEVKPKTGSLHVILSAHSSAVPPCLRATTAAAKVTVDTMQSVPRSLAPPPLHPSLTYRTHSNTSCHVAASPSTSTTTSLQHSITTVAVSSSRNATPAATHRAKPNSVIQCTHNSNNEAVSSSRRIW